MTTMQADRLVDDYLSRLEEAAAHSNGPGAQS
jgi:hypothetical protein